ncbi:hypothetical protein HYH03_000636 [Edaphochlamys debaryana]|uniref:Uncharacterized protein n=1 Tax=Edaphochlamys debaryana TaxID=47281 RepID=A0A836C7L9_9CHLO|nr:hypothetical protein HYH03_000636 [Edaphochlamys debaryana]|eukprot:KAG2502149.1 hypothetical protein HYH03_000636 [Edaphochlamys debaryana]
MATGRSPQARDEELRELGVVLHEPPTPPIRKTVVVDGRKCRVFLSESERRRHIAACKLEVEENCLSGAREACVLRAMDACRPPAWQRWLPFLSRGPSSSPQEVEACEARAMEGCLAGAQQGCTGHAASLCAASHPERMWLE